MRARILRCAADSKPSAFMGLLAMVLLFPVPGYVASMIQDVQGEKMKKTDARVQSVTESRWCRLSVKETFLKGSAQL